MTQIFLGGGIASLGSGRPTFRFASVGYEVQTMSRYLVMLTAMATRKYLNR